MEKLFILSLTFICVLLTDTADCFSFRAIKGCSETEADMSIELNEEPLAYYDYQHERPVVSVPNFLYPIQFQDLIEQAHNPNCKQLLNVLNEVYKNSTEHLEPPWTTIYPRDEVKLNQENDLVCNVESFFPPPVSVWWSRNGVNISNGVTMSSYHRNADGTLGIYSVLSFIPDAGDSYSCTVQHPALDSPQTRTWDVEDEDSSVVPLVVLVGGLIVGLIMTGIGIYLIKKSMSLLV